MKPRRLIALAAVLPLLAQAAPPQTVYRCGPDGRVYSQTPCADGKALTVGDPRSASQRQAAHEVAARDAAQAKQLAEERRQREEATRDQAAAGFRTSPQAEAASAPVRKPKAKAKSAAADPRMSPLMRVPTQAAASK